MAKAKKEKEEAKKAPVKKAVVKKEAANKEEPAKKRGRPKKVVAPVAPVVSVEKRSKRGVSSN